MNSKYAIFVLLPLSAGCDLLPEHWFAYDDAELEIVVDDLAIIDAVVFTSPEAWPKKQYSDALRVGMTDAHVEVTFLGEVVDGALVDGVRDLNVYDSENVGVLDAWRDCVPDEACERTFRFGVACRVLDEGCQGLFSGDAFLSTQGLSPEDDRGGWLELQLVQLDAPQEGSEDGQ